MNREKHGSSVWTWRKSIYYFSLSLLWQPWRSVAGFYGKKRSFEIFGEVFNKNIAVMPVAKSCKSLKQLSLDFVIQNFQTFYERYKNFYGEDNLNRLDVVGPFHSLCNI